MRQGGRGHPGGRAALGVATSEQEKGTGALVGLREGVLLLLKGKSEYCILRDGNISSKLTSDLAFQRYPHG